MIAKRDQTIRLPVFDTVKKTSQLLKSNPKDFFYAYWPSLFILALYTVFGPRIEELKALEQNPALPKTQLIIGWVALFLAFIPAGIISRINLYRLALLGEKPQGLALQFGRREMTALGWTIGLSLFYLIFIIVAVVPGMFMPFSLILTLPIAVIVLVIVNFRLLFIWPAIALDRPVNWRISFAETKHNTLRLMMGPFLISLPLLLVNIVLSIILYFVGISHLATYIALPVQMASFVLNSLFTSLAYYILSPEVSVPFTETLNNDVIL